MELKNKINIFCGHYGSGKTNVAVGVARHIKNQGNSVSVYDLDIVNPYFRTADAKDELEKEGISLIASAFSGSNVDIPLITAENNLIFEKDEYAILDLGGDDRGALALGTFRDKLLKTDYSLFMVVNKFRPETSTIQGVKEIKDEIERIVGLKITGFVNNGNLMNLTDDSVVLDGEQFTIEASKKLGVPYASTTVKQDLFDSLKDKIENLVPIRLIKYNDGGIR